MQGELAGLFNAWDCGEGRFVLEEVVCVGPVCGKDTERMRFVWRTRVV